jgi:hypothetical protein
LVVLMLEHSILQAFLSTPPHQCNAANVVSALSFSAKALGTHRIQLVHKELRGMLLQTLDVLHELVSEHLLNTRQLCNACWAIAKLYDRDHALLPPPPKATALSSESAIGTAETWNMKDSRSKEKAQQERVDETINEIAKQLTVILEESSDDNDDGEETMGHQQQPAKIGEICMASWAYGKLRPRSTPPGWQDPPQLGRLPKNANRHQAERLSAVTANMITFEKWGSFGDNKTQVEKYFSETQKIIDKLFDAIGGSLCRSSPGMHCSDETATKKTILVR